MNPVALFFGFALLAVSVFFIASPFRSSALQKKSAGWGIHSKDSLKSSPEKQRQAVLLALRDLDFDYQAGKVAEEDYQALRAKLVSEAAQRMQSQESQKEASLEALIQARRQARVVAQTLTKEKTNGAQAAGLAGKPCPHCQAPLREGAKFCSKCGAPVHETVCPKCKQPLQLEDRFCPSCGTAVLREKEVSEPAARLEGE